MLRAERLGPRSRILMSLSLRMSLRLSLCVSGVVGAEKLDSFGLMGVGVRNLGWGFD